MKERPILFAGPMVNAILEGRKTQTRRLIKKLNPIAVGVGWSLWWDEKMSCQIRETQLAALRCPYGKRGDRLWVRETWAADYEIGENSRGQGPSPYFYRATDTHPFNPPYDKWRSPLFMKRIASRITLEITDVRVQRLQDISDEDVTAEGVEPFKMTQADIDEMDPNTEEGKLARILGPGQTSIRAAFEFEWHEINGKRAPWESNPWVWAITFKRVFNA